ncbi:hypothetical protein [Nonlabens agnitus]|uniref:Uncharacterized protein n=1 Tax=Nonlabens agnitus TaxID=870484 RepID=A0A2S9WXC3_9FLAO|nr:hypothetical protein [Nonlabens agnitus]PRP68127.1 hypothetical protein BST86_14030 [Nonlabens agnitus]
MSMQLAIFDNHKVGEQQITFFEPNNNETFIGETFHGRGGDYTIKEIINRRDSVVTGHQYVTAIANRTPNKFGVN